MKDEAMKQSLEALEDFVDVIKYDNEQDDIGRRACCDVLSYNPHSESCKAIKSIASLRQAIAELESQEPYGWVSQHTTKGMYEWQFNKEIAGVYQDTAISILPVYTHPPQRTWVGLTDDEIDTWNIVGHESLREFVRAIEAKLKEKNT